MFYCFKQGGSKADDYQIKLDFIQHLRSLPCQLLQLQLSSSNKMTEQLLPVKIYSKPSLSYHVFILLLMLEYHHRFGVEKICLEKVK